jgi:uncharacterized protein (DUF2126 family)/transglutaminase-like putative cysteine protease
MSIRIALHHRTEYHFDRLVNLSPHTIRLKPAPHTRTPIHQYSLKVEPDDHFLNWMQDPFGNFIGRFVFPEKTKKLVIDVNLVADMVTINPFDFFVEEYAEKYPFEYEEQVKKELAPYFEIKDEGPLFKALIDELNQAELGIAATRANEANDKKEDEPPTDQAHIVHYLVALNYFIQQHIDYTVRMEPGVQTCETTLEKKLGSCRDTGWLLVHVLRHMGLAARFVSGYLVQLKADQKSLDGPSGPEEDFTDLHAWTEVFVPGAGWIGLDPTSGLFAGEGHIPLACTPDPVSAAPIVGATDESEVTFKFVNQVFRIHEDPRVTKPYTDKQWQAIQQLGHEVDEKLNEADVRMTMGGEPTFVSIDDMDSPQWNIAALGKHKLERAYDLFLRIRDTFAHKPVLHYGQGKWYPGEQLPRWALTCAWLKSGRAIWENQKLLDAPTSNGRYTTQHAAKLILRITAHLGLDQKNIKIAYEDIPYYLWKEGTLPDNVAIKDNRLDDEMERIRLRRVFDHGLGSVAGYTLPLAWNESEEKWKTSRWSFRRKRMYLIPGDSPMGYRLPLDSLTWEPKANRQKLIDKDPFDEFEHLPELRDRLHVIRNEKFEPWHEEANTINEQLPESISAEQGELVRTALCVEQRNGHLHVFLPPLTKLEFYLDMINAIEAAAVELGARIILEGYEPPNDPRLTRIQVTPDPGVIEVNIHPSENWDELVNNTTQLYEQARLARLSTEKFMLDGRHSGTGGGNHITIGAAKPADSPILRRPHLLKSLLTYWQNHPSLSYLFSGLFMGPTSQSPRVDEARDDALYELGIALSEMTNDETTSPWMVDRLLRNLLVDITGNTHRAEFCIDKLYSPSGTAGRLGLVEFRGYEMPPHAQMSLMQALLLRSLVSRFWDNPYDQKLVHWGTELHDRFMLPHYVERDMNDVLSDMRRAGFDFDSSWLDPFIEFRFPRYGVINIDDVELELRFAIEPWHVLGEEVTAMGTSRYVDSSVERLQVKVKGMTETRHLVTCNGRKVPLQNTGTRGEFVGGVRYKAWHPPSGLHPTIVSQAPLVFDIIDDWNKASIGGCTYHVAHPGGRSYETFPINANEAESRRLSRFLRQGHSGGRIEAPEEPVNPDFPHTLDLRRRSAKGER